MFLSGRVTCGSQQAIEAYKAVLALDALNLSALLGLGSLLAVAGDFEQSLRLFDTAVKQNPRNSECYLGRAHIVVALGQVRLCV
jgi:tetratricopeptide (TPR) repeat protein